MPAIKVLLRQSIASAAVNPPSILFPSAAANRTPILNRRKVYCLGGRSTLAKRGPCLRIAGAHVKGPTTATIKLNNINIYRKRVFMLSSSSTSSQFPSSSERETGREGDKLDRVPSSSSSSSINFVPEMGHGSDKNKQNNGDWVPNGAVSPSKKDQKQDHSSKLLTLPTVLTLARVAAVPVFIGTFYANSWWGATATTSIFVAAAITDWLDGYLARKMCQGSAFGAFLDPVADKLMVAATLVLLCSKPPEIAMFEHFPWLLPVPAIAIIGREITMSAVREWAASQDAKLLQAVAVNNLGKWKTATQMVALTIILATRDSSVTSQGVLPISGVVLLYVSSGLAVWSLVVYMRKIWKVLLR
ncbi:CDP-diacylglycerol--glycerol-3-phosphate 3-phosphatidyltransferase 2 [Amaranthus tricolor]|uniref:CDP-diacylglycerol--glycerol-3-phosphate 3-phosphatidyltransferase 2 n=1 Tax=Amaranthus tricolor TaxID=29722 RepID=UPI00258A1C19|nr:CDP-diacylglycerol--glycerol-3-phosphate 3-phosphatidyltransferase 2 [Amaranthus tricolor]